MNRDDVECFWMVPRSVSYTQFGSFSLVSYDLKIRAGVKRKQAPALAVETLLANFASDSFLKHKNKSLDRLSYHILCASLLLEADNLLPQHQKHITHLFWIISLLSYPSAPYYAISLHFSIFRRELRVDGSLLQIALGTLKCEDAAASKQAPEVSKQHQSAKPLP